ncbi:MAG: hypothetical protein BAA01_10285 [Bacillus thermozeamaize]|uniref:Cytidyltransferase n=1 Tax=Bacillus thermozeamaize TaxID=230954 RepID=A0A1Y3PNQ4_9BACI|nr:MAG: hypothetical protein BAA01_10285 [Bacillus thermozeamaize]
MTSRKYIAMIPARLGSKRIPKKNIRYLAGKPLIKYAIDLALSVGLFDSVWVNTESDELGRVAGEYGALFHKRPADLANDQATNREFVYEFLQKHECDYVVMINTTSPLLTVDTARKFMEFVDNNDYDTVLSVISEKAEFFFKDSPINFSLAEKVNSQLLEPVHKVVWALTAWKRDVFLKLQNENKNPVFGGKLGLFSIPKDESCDLDTEEDWRIAEGFLQARRISNTQLKEYLEI